MWSRATQCHHRTRDLSLSGILNVLSSLYFKTHFAPKRPVVQVQAWSLWFVRNGSETATQ